MGASFLFTHKSMLNLTLNGLSLIDRQDCGLLIFGCCWFGSVCDCAV